MKTLMKFVLIFLVLISLTVGVFAQEVNSTEEAQATEEVIATEEAAATEEAVIETPSSDANISSQPEVNTTLVEIIAVATTLILLGVAFMSRKRGAGLFDLVQNRRFFFLISAAIIVPGLLIMGYSTITTGAPFRLSIDFVGGSIYDLTFVEAGATEDNVVMFLPAMVTIM